MKPPPYEGPTLAEISAAQSRLKRVGLWDAPEVRHASYEEQVRLARSFDDDDLASADHARG